MRGANVNRVIQAVNEMKVLYRDNPKLLYEQLAIMEALMERSTTLSEEDKARLAKDAIMSDPLMDNYSRFQRRLAEEKAKAQAEAQAKAEQVIAEAVAKAQAEVAKAQADSKVLKALISRNFLALVKRKYPDMLDLAKEGLQHDHSQEFLLSQFLQLTNAEDEAAAREILELM
jgi:hypothetical protein